MVKKPVELNLIIFNLKAPSNVNAHDIRSCHLNINGNSTTNY